MLPEDDRMIETCRSVIKCFNVNFRLLKTIYVLLLVCYLNKLQNAWCYDKDRKMDIEKSNYNQIKNNEKSNELKLMRPQT